jgi:hypothetical protein
VCRQQIAARAIDADVDGPRHRRRQHDALPELFERAGDRFDGERINKVHPLTV